MTKYGIDYAGGRPGGSAIKAAGYDFVVRYLSDGGPGLPGKLLTKSEYADLIASGVSVAVNWETTANRMLDGYAAGNNDAKIADQTLRAVGHPANRPIYFSADFDATPAQQNAIDAYLNGAADAISRSRVGVYSGYWIIKRCLDAKTATWAWQTEAWSGGNRDPRAHILQHAQYVVVGGVQCDLNEALQSDFGQHPQGADLTPDESSKLSDIWHALTDQMSSEVPGSTYAAPPRDFWRNTDRAAFMTERTILAQQAAITALTAAVALDHGLDLDEFKVILNDALAKALIHVNVSVDGKPAT